MKSGKPSEILLQRLLQSDNIRNSYILLLEDENGCTKISLQYLDLTTDKTNFESVRMVSSEPQSFLKNRKDFFVEN